MNYAKDAILPTMIDTLSLISSDIALAGAEVELGDSRSIVGNVGRFSIGNRDEARNVLEDAAFVDFINHSFGIFGECVAENHGCMISSGLRFSAMDTLFPDSAADGVQAVKLAQQMVEQ